jgi:hypothetical protein
MPYPVRKMIVLSVTLSVLVSPRATLAAVDQEQPNPTIEDMNRQIADWDKKKADILNEPLDFCDQDAVARQTREYDHALFEQYELRRKLEKVHPTLKEAVQKTVQTFADDGDLVEFPAIVEDYEAASRRGDNSTMNALRAKMSPWGQGLIAQWEHRYFDAIKVYTPLADQGDADAQVRLMFLYSSDYGPSSVTPKSQPNDDALAFKYARVLAANGNRVGLQRLAKVYACGLGTSKDLVHAYVWFSVAAGQSAVSLHTYYEPEDLLRKRDFMAASMSHDDLLRARRLTVQCYKSDYKSCD